MIGSLRISLGALRENARTLRAHVAPAQAAFVVKANAYGHGLIPVARAIAPEAAAFCVYSIEEGLALRASGLEQTIIVLGPSPVELLDEALAAELQITLWDAGTYLDTVANAGRRQRRRFPVHIKIDTGLHRLGFDPKEAPKAIARCMQTPGIAVVGIFSHLASAEELDTVFTLAQVESLVAVANTMDVTGSDKPLRHIAASAAAMLWPQTRLELVRMGIALYGLWPSKETRDAMTSNISLQPALSFESRIIAVRKVEAHAQVGYGGSFTTRRASRIGVVPLGYADGIPRSLSNRGAFIVDGKRCPIVGRVCMNMTLIDLGQTHGRPGSPVTLIGAENGASVTADDWAEWAQTISYEIVTRLPAELPRVYA